MHPKKPKQGIDMRNVGPKEKTPHQTKHETENTIHRSQAAHICAPQKNKHI